uniref:Uncharacterized protein n=1 Tax=Meloidogyne hapla TaxID=6305 RepID=A0A1I8BPG5_MELHA
MTGTRCLLLEKFSKSIEWCKSGLRLGKGQKREDGKERREFTRKAVILYVPRHSIALGCRTVHELSDLIRQCELTTIACTATLLKGIANLWAPVPQELESLADVARTSQPGQEFMSFLQQQQQSNSLLNSDVPTTPNGQWLV